MWTFPANVDYLSIEFASNNTYTLHSKKPLVRATDDTIYLLSGSYTVSSNLREIGLTDFGKLTISDLAAEKIEVTITPTGGTATTTQLDRQTIAPPPASSEKRIKKIETVDEKDGNGVIDFSYTNSKLTNVAFQFDGAAIDEPGIVKTTYRLNAAGLAQSSVVEHNGTAVIKLSCTYNNQRQLISYQSTDGAGKFKEFCSANDVITREIKRYTYKYIDKVNKGGHIQTVMMPQLFSSSDIVDQIGQWCGILGVGSKNPMSQHESGDGNLSYTFDANGYPTRIDVSYPSASADNWYIKQTFE